MNRKKYITRRKYSRFQVLFNSASRWTFLYRRFRHTTRFLQNVNWMSSSLTFSYGDFIRTISLSTHSRVITCSRPNFTAASKKIFFNRTSFFLHNEYYLRMLSFASHIGFINADRNDLEFLDVIQSGTFVNDLTFLTPSCYPSHRSYYFSTVNNLVNVNVKHLLTLLKIVRQVLVWLVLYHAHKK